MSDETLKYVIDELNRFVEEEGFVPLFENQFYDVKDYPSFHTKDKLDVNMRIFSKLVEEAGYGYAYEQKEDFDYEDFKGMHKDYAPFLEKIWQKLKMTGELPTDKFLYMYFIDEWKNIKKTHGANIDIIANILYHNAKKFDKIKDSICKCNRCRTVVFNKGLCDKCLKHTKQGKSMDRISNSKRLAELESDAFEILGQKYGKVNTDKYEKLNKIVYVPNFNFCLVRSARISKDGRWRFKITFNSEDDYQIVDNYMFIGTNSDMSDIVYIWIIPVYRLSGYEHNVSIYNRGKSCDKYSRYIVNLD
ncbi:MAG: hypothetical protein ACOCQD_00320 [archaeon]